MPNRTSSLLLIILPVITGGLLFVQFLLSNNLAAIGAQVYATDEQAAQLQDQNEFLRQQLAVAQSLSVVSKKAEEFGYIKPTRYVTVTQELPVALR